MKINFVTEPEHKSWILRPLCECLSRNIAGSTVSTEPDEHSDWNIFFNYALWTPTASKTAAWFTHKEAEGQLRDMFDRVAERVHLAVCPSWNTYTLLPAYKSIVLPTYPTHERFYKDLVLGICGRKYSSGRKRMHWADEIDELEYVKVLITGGKLSAEELPSFYDSIDYLLVTSNNEGGPQPVLEALARGVPVIAPDVGFCWEYPVLKYDGTKQGLLKLIRRLVIPRDGWKYSADMLVGYLECV